MQTGGFQNVYIISKKRAAHGRIDPFRHEYSGFSGHLYGQLGAVGVAAPTVQANFTDFSYVALVNQTATNGTGTFNEQGAGFFSSSGSRVWPMSWPMPE